jgi:hypothetical protein
MSPTTKVVVTIVAMQVVKIAIIQAVGNHARKQLRETRPDLARYFDR